MSSAEAPGERHPEFRFGRPFRGWAIMQPEIIMGCPMLALERRLRMPLLALAACLASGAAWCQSIFLPYGSTQYEHSNNIFYLPNSSALYLVSGDSALGDSDLKTVGGVDVNYLWGRQRFYGTIEGRNFEYDHYSRVEPR